jgi:hypothetical protein
MEEIVENPHAKTMNRIVSLIAALAVLGFLVLNVSAQTETGQLTGTVLDPAGAAVPNAKVTVRNLATGSSRTTTTADAGIYVVSNLLPGTYRVTVEAAGFSTSERNVDVTVGSRIGLDVNLQVGQATTVVQVSEAAAAVNTETQTLGTTITTKEILELPTLTRNPYDLVSTAGNVSPNDPSGKGVGYAINGQRGASTNVLLDGAANNDEFGAVVGQTVPLDSVQEFSVLTNNFTAEFGRASGGIVNVATKSGTNEFHGTAYEFNRVSSLASNSFNSNANGIPKPVFTRNQFGESVGGPVVKNKIFFFNNTEWIRVRSSANQVVYVPTPEFIAASAPATQQFFSQLGTLRSGLTPLGTFSRSQLLARGFDPCKGLAATSKCLSLPSTLPMFQRLAYNYPSDSGGGPPQNTYETVARVDINATDQTQMYFRYALYNANNFVGTNSSSPYSGFDSGSTNVDSSVLLSVVHTFTPRFVSQSKAVFNRLNNQQPFGATGPVPTLYLGSANVATNLLGDNVALPGYLPYSPGNGIPFGGPQNFLEFYQDNTYSFGKHNFRFGGTYTYLRDNRTFGAYETAVEVLGNSFSKGVENFLSGQLYQFQAAVYPQGKFPCGATTTPDCTLTLPVGPPNFSRSNRYHDWGAYVQDSWKIRPRVTLNLGLRWELFGVQHNKNSALDSNFYLGQGSTIFDQIAAGKVLTVPNSPNKRLWNPEYHDFAPRLGFAWDIFGDGSTSFRGGYGIGYERNFGNVTFNVIQNPPNYSVLSLFSGVDLPTIAVSANNSGPLAGSTGTKALGKVSLRAVNPDIKTAYAHFYSAALERRITEGSTIALEYSGSHGVNQYGIANINRAGSGNYYANVPCDPNAGNCTARLLATQYSNINFRTNGGFSDYNALNVRLNVRNIANTGIQLVSNYTWSHAIDTLSDTFSSSGNQANLGWLDPFHPEVDKGDAYYDLRHRFTFAAVYEIGRGRFNSNAFSNYVFGGWSLNPIFTANTGSPYSLYDCTNASTVCPYAMFTGAVPRGVPSNITATSTPNVYKYLDVSKVVDSSYVNAKTGVSDFGPFPKNMIGRNAFRTPGAWNLDFAIHKNIKFSERTALQLRGEFFNVFNHPNLYVNTGDNDVSSVDYVSASYGGRRNVQLAAKFIF